MQKMPFLSSNILNILRIFLFFSSSFYDYIYAEKSLSKNVPLEKLEKLDDINDKIIDIYNHRKLNINYSLFNFRTKSQTHRLINAVVYDEYLSKKEKINYIKNLVKKERVVNSFSKKNKKTETLKSKIIGYLIRKKLIYLIYFSTKGNQKLISKKRK